MSDAPDAPLKETPLHALHVELGARMVPFAGYAMPVQYPTGILQEHLHTRAAAGLFDVSHMGQVRLTARDGGDPAEALERLVPGDIQGLAVGQTRYTQFTDAAGGILDDLMVTRRADDLFLVVNAARKDHDIAHLRAALEPACRVEVLADRALLALQGPQAATVLSHYVPVCPEMAFMTGRTCEINGVPVFATRSGYTGEDGFELSLPAERAEEIARLLLGGEEEDVWPVGLGARDSLRLEAGLCLYGHDIDTTTSPVEAGLLWSIGPRRRAEGGFPGAAAIQAQIKDGPTRRRVGLKPDGKAPAREGTEIRDAAGETVLGAVTSGGFGPSAGGPVAMGYVAAPHAAPGGRVTLMVRGKPLPAEIVRLPFVPHNYHRG